MNRLSILLAAACLNVAVATTTIRASAAYEPDFQARKDHLLNFVINDWSQPFPNFSDAQKHYWATAIALIEHTDEGIAHPQVNDGDATNDRPPRYWGILKYDGESASGTVSDANRGSGSHVSFSWNDNVFHFIFPGLAYLMGMHPDIAAWEDPHHRDNNLTYRENYLRYVLTRSDNYNAFTGEGTENHISMSRPSGWVLAKEAERLGLAFAGQPFSAAERAAQMREWIMDWSKRVYEVGIGEWDSGTYHMVALQGWLTAFAYAGSEHGWDPEVRAAARAVLDYYAATLAIKHVNYHIAGGESRSGRNYSRMNNGTAYLAYLWFADTAQPPPQWRGNNPGEVIYAAVSDYRPPLQIVDVARKSPSLTGTYHGTKPSYLMQQAAQSVDVVHMGPGYTLGSTSMNIGSFHASTWQIVPWKLMVQRDGWSGYPLAVITGNGGFYGAGISNTRDPWMQTVQHDNVLIQMHRVPANASSIVSEVQNDYNAWKAAWYNDFTSRWSSPDWGGFNGDSYAGRTIPLNFQAAGGSVTNARTCHINIPGATATALNGGVRFAAFADTYIAVRSIRAATPGFASGRFTDSGATGELFGLVMEVGTAAEHGAFSEFQAAVLADTSLDLSQRDSALSVSYTSLAGDVIDAQYETSGTWIEPDYDWNYGVATAGGVALMHAHPWRQPDWPSGEGHGRQPSWSVNGTAVDPTAWPLFEGPLLRLDGGRMEILSAQDTVLYAVDYASDVPQFTTLLPATSISADGSELLLSFATESGLRYSIESSTDLANWSAAQPAFAGDGTTYELQTSAPAIPTFWRVVVRP